MSITDYQNEYKRKYQNEYLTLSALEDGEIKITIPDVINSTHVTSLSYSRDKLEWVETDIDDTNQTITIPVSKGDSIYLKGIAKQLYESGDDSSVYIDSSANISASGNIMSLLYRDEFKGKTVFPPALNGVLHIYLVIMNIYSMLGSHSSCHDVGRWLLQRHVRRLYFLGYCADSSSYEIG